MSAARGTVPLNTLGLKSSGSVPAISIIGLLRVGVAPNWLGGPEPELTEGAKH